MVAFFYFLILCTHCTLYTVHYTLYSYFSSAKYLMVRTIWLV